MKFALLLSALVVVPTALVPECVVVHDRICFHSQSEYDRYMGWDTKQQQLETEANN
jgi:hypothetical protein